MGKPAARLTDMHVCPMQTPAVVPIPHVGGAIIGPGCMTVLIGKMPAAVMGDMCICVGPPASIMLGSTGVFFGGKAAARMGDSTAHGGKIVGGYPTVLIGEKGGGGGGGGGGLSADALSKLGAANAANVMNKQALENAAQNGEEKAERTDKEDFKAQFTLVDEADKGSEGVKYEIETSDGKKHSGKTDSSGKTENLSGYTTADCKVTFLNK